MNRARTVLEAATAQQRAHAPSGPCCLHAAHWALLNGTGCQLHKRRARRAAVRGWRRNSARARDATSATRLRARGWRAPSGHSTVDFACCHTALLHCACARAGCATKGRRGNSAKAMARATAADSAASAPGAPGASDAINEARCDIAVTLLMKRRACIAEICGARRGCQNGARAMLLTAVAFGGARPPIIPARNHAILRGSLGLYGACIRIASHGAVYTKHIGARQAAVIRHCQDSSAAERHASSAIGRTHAPIAPR
jgi:hypothetical protein